MPLTLKDFTYATFLTIDFGESTGSGFRLFHDKKEYLITAKHVVCNVTYNNVGIVLSEELRTDISITSKNYKGHEAYAYRSIVDLSTSIIKKIDNADIVIIELVEGKNYEIVEKGVDISPAAVSDLVSLEKIEIASNIFIVGFPSSLIDQKDFEIDRPLLRSGIVAGINYDKNTFIIDSPAFYGNSGGPVIQKNEEGIFIIGLVSRYVPFVTDWYNTRERQYSRQEFYNSGYAICEPLDKIIDYLQS